MTAKRSIQILVSILLCIICHPLVAQQFPVKVQVQTLQPVSAQLSNLYSGTQARMIVTLLNTDLQKPVLRVRLRLNIKGTTVALRNRDYGYYPEIALDAGIPLQLSLNDLAPYFNIDNMEVSGVPRTQLAQNGKLPDGFYSFCVEVVELNSGQLVSNDKQGCAPPVWISTSEPPLLNLPRKGEAVSFREPLNIVFNWTPRHMGSPNAAFQTEYEFTLVELWDNGVLPEAGFGTMPPLYQATTPSTTLLYGPAEPALLPGKRYAWRIRAKAKQGVDEFDVFLNNGYSEIFYFTLQEDCQPPQQPVATVQDGRISITWLPQPKMFEYLVEYREQGKDNAEWFNVKTNSTSVMIYDAVPGRKYEYRVGGFCSLGNKTLGDPHGFVVPSRDTSRSKNCGLLPDIKLTNQTPIQQLQADDQIMAGDFPVRLLQVQGAGSYSGYGYITIPFLGYNRLKVKFENITVNTDRQLIGGVIMTTFDPLETQVVGTGAVADAIGNFASVVNDLISMTLDMDYSAITNRLDSLAEDAPDEVKDVVAQETENIEKVKQEYDAAKDAYENATTPEEKEKARQEMDAAKRSFNQSVQNIANAVTAAAATPPATSTLITVNFKQFATQNAGFDPNTFPQYPSYDTLNGKPVPHKSVKMGTADKVTVEIVQDTMAARVFFDKTAKITNLTPVKGSKKLEDFSITMTAADSSSAITAKLDSLKGPTLAKLHVSSYKKLSRKMALIYIDEENDDIQVVAPGVKTASPTAVCVRSGPNKFLDTKAAVGDTLIYDPVLKDSVIVAGRDSICNTTAKNANTLTKQVPGTLADLKAFMNKVYEPANIEFTDVDTLMRLNANFDLNKDGKFEQAGGFGSPEFKVLMDSVRNKLKTKGDTYDYYVLLTDNCTDPKLMGRGPLLSTDPKKYRFTLVISDIHNKPGKLPVSFYNTVAHEVGHGVFDLQHPFHEPPIKAKGYTQGTDRANFMDYQDGDASRKYQWNQMHINDKIRKYGK